MPIDDLLAGGGRSAGTCADRAAFPADFENEETVVEDRPREAVLKLVK